MGGNVDAVTFHHCTSGKPAREVNRNELLRDLPHTKEEFIEVLTEIDAYEKYCREDPDYPNNRAVFAIKNIQETYKRRLDKHDFL